MLQIFGGMAPLAPVARFMLCPGEKKLKFKHLRWK